MSNIFSFFAGILVGAAVALLYAPMSGEDLRTEIKAEAETEFKKAEVEWNKRLKEINEKVDAMRIDVKSYIEGESTSAEGEGE
ncbi:MAG: YtxH domain-containing protein [Candidatus Promineifilaceae bacterium]|jgi:gas vesicle protein